MKLIKTGLRNCTVAIGLSHIKKRATESQKKLSNKNLNKLYKFEKARLGELLHKCSFYQYLNFTVITVGIAQLHVNAYV